MRHACMKEGILSLLHVRNEAASDVEDSIESFLVSIGLVGCIRLNELLRHVESLRGRRIVLRKLRTTNAQLTGLWFPSERVDKILVRSGLSDLHRLHVILHECGHMILRHRGCTGVFAGPSSSAFTETGIEARALLGDGLGSEDEEAAAESFAHRLGPFFLHSAVLAGSEFEAEFE